MIRPGIVSTGTLTILRVCIGPILSNQWTKIDIGQIMIQNIKFDVNEGNNRNNIK